MNAPTSSAPLISVIMPVYNGSEFLQTSIESVLNQTESRFELLAIDDASTDNSVGILKKYQAKDPRIKVLENTKNQGVSSSRNRALKHAKGQYIALMDCDDICIHERFSTQIHRIQQLNLDICGSSLLYFGDKERTKTYPEDDYRIKLNLFCDAPSVATPAVMIRKDILNEIRFDPDLNFGEDTALYIQLALEKHTRFGNCPEPLLKYRIHKRQASQKLLEQKHHLFTEVFYQLLQKHCGDISVEQLALHYELIKKKRVLKSDMVEQYSQLLIQLSNLLDTSETESAEYWYRFCAKHLKSSKAVAVLYKSLSNRPQTTLHTNLYMKGLLADLIRST
jgi:glycosyltransferase involved in cell wall biosynthesis